MQVKTKLGVISVGSDVPIASGIVSIHSKFSNVVNLTLQSGELFSLVTEKVGPGPNNIVLNVKDLSFVKSFNWTENEFTINKEKILRNNIKIYNFNFKLMNLSKVNFLAGLSFFERILIKDAPALSSAFLLDNRRKNFFITPFEKNLEETIRKNVDGVMKGHLSNIEKLKGLGFGLTPQGDDLIDGFVLALVSYELFTGENTFRIRNKIFSLAKTENIISNTFLKYAVQGKLYERIGNIIEAIACNDKEKIILSARSLLDIGETSGSDIGTGFILMSRKLFEGGVEWL